MSTACAGIEHTAHVMELVDREANEAGNAEGVQQLDATAGIGHVEAAVLEV